MLSGLKPVNETAAPTPAPVAAHVQPAKAQPQIETVLGGGGSGKPEGGPQQ
jgi:hypothetical protein